MISTKTTRSHLGRTIKPTNCGCPTFSRHDSALPNIVRLQLYPEPVSQAFESQLKKIVSILNHKIHSSLTGLYAHQ